MIFVLFHGSFSYNDGNWFPYLKKNLEDINQRVIAPQFPVDDLDEITANGVYILPKNQKLSTWMNTFNDMYSELKQKDKLCFVGHSLGSLFILHLINKYEIQLDSAIFVSPFLTKLNKSWQIDHVNNPFYKDNFDFEKLQKLIPVSYSVSSNNDPYVDLSQSERFAEMMKSSKIYINDGQHLNSDASVYRLPIVYDLCTSRLSLNEYMMKLNNI